MGAGTSTFHQFEAEELAQYAEKHLKENGEAVAALIRSNEIDGDLALSLREMGDDALVEFARDSEEDQAKLKRALEELDESFEDNDFQKAIKLSAQLQYWHRIETAIYEKMEDDD